MFGLSLSADQRFLLSSSEDTTIRLWHTDTARNVVAYKGHTSAVWDVAFSPLSQHFASAAQSAHTHIALLCDTSQALEEQPCDDATASTTTIPAGPATNHMLRVAVLTPCCLLAAAVLCCVAVLACAVAATETAQRACG